MGKPEHESPRLPDGNKKLRGSLGEVKEKTDKDRVMQYLSFSPKLQEWYVQYRFYIERSLAVFKDDAQCGEQQRHFRENLHKDFMAEFDGLMLRVFLKIRLKTNPQIQNRLLKNSYAQIIVPWSDDRKLIEENHGWGTTILGSTTTNEIGINVTAAMNLEYSTFKRIFIHEFMHACFQGIPKTNYLFEGITDLLANEATEQTFSTPQYAYNTLLAHELMSILPDELLSWYSGGTDEGFEYDFMTQMTPRIGREAAALLYNDIAHADREINRQKGALLDEGIAMAGLQKCYLREDQVYDLTFDLTRKGLNLDRATVKDLFKKISGMELEPAAVDIFLEFGQVDGKIKMGLIERLRAANNATPYIDGSANISNP